MKSKIEKKNGRLELFFTVKIDEWEKHMQKAYEQNKGKYKVDGFRKGHAPRRVLEKIYGLDLFFEDAIYNAATEYYIDFLDKNKEVVPVARPTLIHDSVKNNGKEISFGVTVATKPEVELGEYKGLKIEKTVVEEVTESDIENKLKQTQQRNARMLEVTDRAVENGDTVNLDYSGSVDGTKFDGGTAEKQTLEVGSGAFIPGFEEQLIGMNIGETKNINVSFPSEYHAEDLKGKAAVFEVKINGITTKELPEIDDEFANDVSEFSTLDEYKADIKRTLTEERENTAKDADRAKVLDAVVGSAKVEIPFEMIDEQTDDYIEEFKQQLAYQGLTIEGYFKYTRQTMEQLRENYKERSEKAVRTRLVFEAIVKAEKIEADEEAVLKKAREYAVNIGEDAEKFVEGLKPQERAYFENQVVTEKLIDLLIKENPVS